MKVVEVDPRNEAAWAWLTGLMVDLEDRIIACENVLTINPDNEKVRAYLAMLLQQRAAQKQDSRENKSSPFAIAGSWTRPAAQGKNGKPSLLAQAEEFEQKGKVEEAIHAYEMLASQTRDSAKFDQIFKHITRLEALQKEKIQHVAPASSILRLTFAWPLLYFSFALVQMGFNPFAHSRFYLWLALPIVALGSFLLALSEIRTRHVIWERLFMEQGSGSGFARIVLAVAGWVFVLVPFGLILLDSLGRLQSFRIPPEPF
jgi:hypothetical protein